MTERYDPNKIGLGPRVPDFGPRAPAPAPAERSDDYAVLRRVLGDAYDQAAKGKGKERHAQSLPFERQPMQKLIELYGPGFAAGQIGKKSQEALRLDPVRAKAELLGVIVYAAGLIVHLERQNGAPL